MMIRKEGRKEGTRGRRGVKMQCPFAIVRSIVRLFTSIIHRAAAAAAAYHQFVIFFSRRRFLLSSRIASGFVRGGLDWSARRI